MTRKQTGALLFALLLVLCATACAKPAVDPVPESTPAQTAAVDPVREAYRQALTEILTTRTLPDGTKLAEQDNTSMSLHQFAVADVNADGREELLLLLAANAIAGEMELVFLFDNGQWRTLLSEFPVVEFYANGSARAIASHNQTPGGEFWPYTLYVFDAASGAYQQAGSVYAWDKRFAPSYEGQAFPIQTDVSGTGVVYFLSDATGQAEAPVDETVYKAWREGIVGNGVALTPVYLPLTEANIQSVR